MRQKLERNKNFINENSQEQRGELVKYTKRAREGGLDAKLAYIILYIIGEPHKIEELREIGKVNDANKENEKKHRKVPKADLKDFTVRKIFRITHRSNGHKNGSNK